VFIYGCVNGCVYVCIHGCMIGAEHEYRIDNIWRTETYLVINIARVLEFRS